MRKIFWFFTIRRNIKRRIANAEREYAFFEHERVNGIHAGKPDVGGYLKSRVEMKIEVITILKNLL